jgi:hypothetical protein
MARDPVGSQRKVFEDLIRRGRGTAFGREHGFADIRTPADYASRVPIGDYVAYLPWINRMLAQEPDVCWPGVTEYFAQTSGTTAGDKRIPVTDAMQKSNQRAALAIFAYYARGGKGKLAHLLGGKMLFLGGSTALETQESGAKIGDLSGIATGSIHWPLSKRYEPGLDLALLEDWEEKIQRVAQRVADRDVRFVTGMPSWVKVLFDRVCDLRGVDPAGGISRVWPNLGLIVHGGVNFDPYRATFASYFQDSILPDTLEVYPASEGFVAIQAQADRPGMELQVDNGIFFEFVPLDRWGDEGAPRLTLEQVEPGINYSVVISTNAGLWAYDIGDVVRFESVCPPRIVFAGRNRLFINAFGENVIAEQVCQAVAHAAEQTGAVVLEFTAGPCYPTPGRPARHEYVIEFQQPPSEGVEAFAGQLDSHLRGNNTDYNVKRSGDLGMQLPNVVPAAPGTFYDWMKARGKLGGQHKVPVCANDRRYLDELIEMARPGQDS